MEKVAVVGVVRWIDGGGCLFVIQGGGAELTLGVVRGSPQVRWVGGGEGFGWVGGRRSLVSGGG